MCIGVAIATLAIKYSVLILLPENGGEERKTEVTLFLLVMPMTVILTTGRNVKECIGCVIQLEHEHRA